jgi:hypothetical protein
MSNAAIAGPSKSVAVTVLGLLTLLLGCAYVAFGGSAIFAGADWFVHGNQEPMADVIALGGIVPGFIIMFGIFFLPPGILALCAGAGVMMRKPWGHMLTYVVAIIAITLGLIWAIGSDQDLPHIAVGAAQILYGILAVVVLTVNCAEFYRPTLSSTHRTLVSSED